jgi:hypothetical protein
LTFLRKLIQLSFKAGYARNSSESANPQLWEGLAAAWAPGFGQTKIVKDLTGRGHDATLSGGTGLWERDGMGYGSVTDLGYTVDLSWFGPPDQFTNVTSFLYSGNSVTDKITTGLGRWASGSTQLLGRFEGSSLNNMRNLLNMTGTNFDNTTTWDAAKGRNLASFSYDLSTNTGAQYLNGDYLETSEGTGTITPWTTHYLYGRPSSSQKAFLYPHVLGTLTLLYDRILSRDELDSLNADPYAPFRQRRSFFSSVSALNSNQFDLSDSESLEIEESSDTSKIITVKRSKHVEPSYKSGYAQSAGESAHPNLWDGLVGAWMPSLGVTGGILRDVSENENHGTLTNMDPATDWVTTSKGLALDFDGVNDYVEVPDNESLSIATSDWTIVCLLKNLQGTTNTGKFEGIVQKGYFEANTGWEILRNGTNASGPIGCVAVAYGNQAQYGNTAMSSTDFSSIVWRKKGTNSTLWLNGNLDDETTLVSRNEYSSPLVIGQRNLSAYSPGYFNGPISSVYIFDRALSPNEIQTLYVDSLAPFRKKQQVAFNAYPLTLLEKIRSVAKPTTTRAISVKKNSVPSYKSGYAKSASESANPNLWNGLVGAWMPSLGVTGDTLRDVSGNGNHGTLTNMDSATDWVATSKGLALDFDGVNDYVRCSRKINTSIEEHLTIAMWCRFDKMTSTQAIVSTYSNTGQQFEVGRQSGKFSWLQDGNSVDAVSTNSFSVGDHFAAITRTGTTNNWQITFFIDDQPADQHTTSVNPAQDGGGYDFTFGRAGSFGGFYFDGIIYSSFVYNRALSPNEIKQLYVDSLAPFRKKTTIGYQPSKELRGLFRT